MKSKSSVWNGRVIELPSGAVADIPSAQMQAQYCVRIEVAVPLSKHVRDQPLVARRADQKVQMGRQGWHPSAASNLPTGPSWGIG
jgi:hypothetical protein